MNKLEQGALKIINTLIKNGHKAYYAGGCVRDKLLGNDFKDIDIATSAKPDEILKLFKKTIPVGVQFGVIIVVVDKIQYEVATFRKDGEYQDGRRPETVEFTNEKEDVLRRSFTINGMLFDPLNNKLIDYVGGEEDLKKGIIRAIGTPNQRFQEDKLRMLRAIRFAARFSFIIEEHTWEAIQKNQHLIHEVSAERIRDEIVKILTEGKTYRGLTLLDRSGLLNTILPEVYSLIKAPADESDESLFDITLKMSKELIQSQDKSLCLSVLFYYIKHPGNQDSYNKVTIKYTENFENELAVRLICDRLKLSNQEKESVVDLLGQKNVIDTIDSLDIPTLKKFIRQHDIENHLELYKINCKALDKKLANYHYCLNKVKEYKQMAPTELFPEKLIDGQKLKEMGYRPGPDFKTILDELENLQLAGKILSEEDAKHYILKNYPLS